MNDHDMTRAPGPRRAGQRSPSTRFFDRWSPTYDRIGLQAVAYRPVHDAVLARLVDEEPSVVVDLGCGTGQLTQRLLDRFPGAEVVAVDLSPGMLAKAAARLAPLTPCRHLVVRADAHHLPLARGSVDVVVCTESFHWYRDQPGVLDGLVEALVPDGRLLIASTAMATRPGERAVRRVSAISGQPVRALTPGQLRDRLQRAGFQVTHQRRIPRLGGAWPVLPEARRR